MIDLSGTRPLRVLFVTSELAPLVKTGGLADVSGALPPALRALGIDCRVLIPGYPSVLSGIGTIEDQGAIEPAASFPPAALALGQSLGVPVYAVRSDALYARAGTPYQDAQGHDWPDNALRFGLLSKVAAMLGAGGFSGGWVPDIVQANDWQAGLAPAYLKLGGATRCRTVMAIHNLAYQGNFDPGLIPALGLPPESFAVDGVEFYGALSFLKAGLYYADRIVTVSPTYAEEIQTEPYGHGLHGLLGARRADLAGILNGIDDGYWNPATDTLIFRRYDRDGLSDKRVNKTGLQQRLGLETRAEIPLFGIVGRLATQKGLDLVLDLLPDLIGLPAQLAVLGSGEPDIEAAFIAAAASHPGRVGLGTGFNESLAHQIEAGADFFLMPSRYEPCGLNQMYSQRYGTPPVAHATGGLADSIVDCTEASLADGTGTGFLFRPFGREAFREAILRAVSLYRRAGAYRALQRNGMERDFSWTESARRYADLYRDLAGAA
jgi:starch synthase